MAEQKKKALYIAEKPSVAREFAKALKLHMNSLDGYMESEEAVITWCVGHLVTMSYPEVYGEELKRWSLSTLPFIPEEYRYEVIASSAKQFGIVSGLLNRPDVDTIYVCTDSGREGEYIYRLVEQQAHVTGKTRKRVWIDSQTEEEILRGIREAKDLSAYDDLSAAAYLRAQEDYLMGINFSRVLTLKYGSAIQNYLRAERRPVVAVGRVMTCVLGMVVLREREIRAFDKTPFYRVLGDFMLAGRKIGGEWRAVEGSRYANSPLLYKENGFRKRESAETLISELGGGAPDEKGVCPTSEKAVLIKSEKKTEKKNAPLLYNLAELQNVCSRFFKISPDETLKIAQELYEKKLTTYPRTDARVLSTAVAKEIDHNIRGLCSYPVAAPYAKEVLEKDLWKGLASSRYVNDKQITDHYAIIPTGQGFGSLNTLSATSAKVYELIVRRFLAIFYPPQVFLKLNLELVVNGEHFFAGFKLQQEEGWHALTHCSFFKDKKEEEQAEEKDKKEEEEELVVDPAFLQALSTLKKGAEFDCAGLYIKEGETSPPKRYNSGSLILAMENAGQLIEDEELRAMIKGSGIGTSATRAGILEKLVNNKYLALNKKTQIITPTLIGEMIFDVVRYSIGSLLNPELTASWEVGLSGVADGTVSSEEYRGKLNGFVSKQTEKVKQLENAYQLRRCFDYAAAFYPAGGESKKKRSSGKKG
ncbi:MAG: type IA DNA topoisomerase [Lachnospiraceae bacterium]|nr:type IA DNA topoisomerase [Lachnospiraceae bacterium]